MFFVGRLGSLSETSHDDGRLRLCHREADRECRPVGPGRADGDLASVCGDDPIGDEETEPESSAARVLAAGSLPKGAPLRTWGGRGAGAPCAACDLTIQPQHIEFEVEFDTSPVLRFHLGCFNLWNDARRDL